MDQERVEKYLKGEYTPELLREMIRNHARRGEWDPVYSKIEEIFRMSQTQFPWSVHMARLLKGENIDVYTLFCAFFEDMLGYRVQIGNRGTEVVTGSLASGDRVMRSWVDLIVLIGPKVYTLQHTWDWDATHRDY